LEAKTGTADINVIDLARNTESRLTFDPAVDVSPIWSPDGSRIIWHSSRAQTHQLYQKLASGVGQEEPLLQSDVLVTPTSWSADGKFLLYSQFAPKTLMDIWILPLDGDRKPFPFLQTQFIESGAQFSPDGRWAAYESNESGKYEIYVQTFPAGSGKWQVSTGGGQFPQWRGDGKELFYLSPDRKLMAVEVKLGATFEAGLPKALFDLAAAKVRRDTYTVTADGQRFLFPRLLRENAVAPFAVVVNWTAEVKK
jgi:Tol biopolymer transport system component